jgi:hypothetical protein
MFSLSKQVRLAYNSGWSNWKAGDESYGGKYSFSSLVGLPPAEVNRVMGGVNWLKDKRWGQVRKITQRHEKLTQTGVNWFGPMGQSFDTTVGAAYPAILQTTTASILAAEYTMTTDSRSAREASLLVRAKKKKDLRAEEEDYSAEEEDYSSKRVSGDITSSYSSKRVSGAITSSSATTTTPTRMQGP